jgi:hypothetical protein
MGQMALRRHWIGRPGAVETQPVNTGTGGEAVIWKPLSRLLLAGVFVSFAFSGATSAQTAMAGLNPVLGANTANGA